MQRYKLSNTISITSFQGWSGVNLPYACRICDKSFAISSNPARHKKSFHGTRTSSETNFSINAATVMQHPFACIVAGCTQSGTIKSTSSTHDLVLYNTLLNSDRVIG